MELRANVSEAPRTYWHLEALRRVPSEYDIATSRLLYYPAHAAAIESPVVEWYRRYQQASTLRFDCGERFEDPRETTYTLYTKLAKERETFVEGLFRSAEETGYDQRLAPTWVSALDAWLPVLLYPCHGLQMAAAYVAQMAPAGRLVIAGLFQSADELRRVQRIAYRVRKLQQSFPEFGASGKQSWLERAAWQPLRRVVEQLLVTYDFGEAFVALQLVYKPAFDRLFLQEFARLAERSGDTMLAKLFFSLDEDARWQRLYTHEFLELALAETPQNRRPMAEFVHTHQARAREAFGALEPLWTSADRPWASVMADLEAEREQAFGALGVGTGAGS
jgi:toluene monooxygenase system protein E